MSEVTEPPLEVACRMVFFNVDNGPGRQAKVFVLLDEATWGRVSDAKLIGDDDIDDNFGAILSIRRTGKDDVVWSFDSPDADAA